MLTKHSTSIQRYFLPIKLTIIVIAIFLLSASLALAQPTYQTWTIAFSTENDLEIATLDVYSDGFFSASGYTGRIPQGTYEISITGWMSGTYMSFTETASHIAGNLSINANGDGTLDKPFPASTSANGTISGTTTDLSGTKTFSMNWTAKQTAGGLKNDLPGQGFFTNLETMFPLIIAAVVTIIAVEVSVAIWREKKSKQKKD